MYDINEILEYWRNLEKITKPQRSKTPLDFHDWATRVYDFLPILCMQINENKKHLFLLINNYLFNRENLNDEYKRKNELDKIKNIDDVYFTFVSKPSFKNMSEFLVTSYGYLYHDINDYNLTNRTDVSIKYMWKYRNNIDHYNLIWLYTLTKQILDNIHKTNLLQNFDELGVNYLLSKLQHSIVKYAETNNIELPTYSNNGSLILPKGILFADEYKTSNIINDIYDIINLLFMEMQHIKSSYYMLAYIYKIPKEFEYILQPLDLDRILNEHTQNKEDAEEKNDYYLLLF